MINPNTRIRIIAAAGTLLVAALILLVLLLTKLYPIDPSALAQSKPQAEEQEEIFLDAEFEDMSVDQDQPDIVNPDDEAAAPQGEPEQAPEENKQIKVADKTLPKEPVKNPKEVTQKQPSETKTKNTANNDTENKAVTSKVGGAFGGLKNGNNVKEGGSGTGSVGLGVSGLSGRKRLTDPNLKPVVPKKVTIKVKVTVNADGRVIAASFFSESGPGAGNTALRNQCIEAAKGIRWSKKEGAPDESGILTFNLTPPKN